MSMFQYYPLYFLANFHKNLRDLLAKIVIENMTNWKNQAIDNQGNSFNLVEHQSNMSSVGCKKDEKCARLVLCSLSSANQRAPFAPCDHMPNHTWTICDCMCHITSDN